MWQLEVRHGLATVLAGAPPGSLKVPEVSTPPASQGGHPGWLNRATALSAQVLEETRELERSARRSDHRVWLVSSPALHPERTVFPAFTAWQRTNVVQSPVIGADLLVTAGIWREPRMVLAVDQRTEVSERGRHHRSDRSRDHHPSLGDGRPVIG